MKTFICFFATLFLFYSCDPPHKPQVKKILSNPQVRHTWRGYNDGNIIKLVKIDTLIRSELIQFAAREHKFTRPAQNIYYYFYLGHEPKPILVPEHQAPNMKNPKKSSLFLAHNVVKSSEPDATVTIYYTEMDGIMPDFYLGYEQ